MGAGGNEGRAGSERRKEVMAGLARTASINIIFSESDYLMQLGVVPLILAASATPGQRRLFAFRNRHLLHHHCDPYSTVVGTSPSVSFLYPKGQTNHAAVNRTIQNIPPNCLSNSDKLHMLYNSPFGHHIYSFQSGD